MAQTDDLKRFDSVRKMIEELSLLTRSEATEKTYLDGLRYFLRDLEHSDNNSDLDRLIDDLRTGRKETDQIYGEFVKRQSSSGLAPSTVRVRAAAVQKFLEANGFKVKKKPKVKKWNLYEDVLPSREILVKALHAGDLRCSTAILMLASSGMRVSELVDLRLSGIDMDMEKVPTQIRISGARREGGRIVGAKERKSRVTFISEEAKQSLQLYLDKRRQQGQEVGPRAAVIGTDKGEPMSKSNLAVILRNAFKVAGSVKESEGPGGRYSLHPHILRKWFKTQLISSGVPGPIADRLCGHSRYMAREYELYTEDQLRDWYLKAMPNLSFVQKPEVDEDRMKLDTLFLLAKSLGLSETKISEIKNTLAKSGEMTPETAAELIGKELIAPIRLKAAMSTDKESNPGNPGNPGKPNCRAKIITEEELERYLEAGWEIVGQLSNRKMAVKKALSR